MNATIKKIKHVWWDLDGTIYKMPTEFEKLKYNRRFELYSEIVNKPITDQLKKEYMKIYEKCGSHSAVFIFLGKKKGFWQTEHQKIDLLSYLQPDQKTTGMFIEFKTLPYLHSIFTNRKTDYVKKILGHMKIEHSIFKHILTNEDIKHPKPHVDGYNKIIKLSDLKPNQILYVGDRIMADILPAKKVGLQTALTWSEKNKSDADYTFFHVGDLISLFK